MNLGAIENAKRTAMKKVTRWADVQSRAQERKVAAGNAALRTVYMHAEIRASQRRARHEQAMHVLCEMERRAPGCGGHNPTRRMCSDCEW